MAELVAGPILEVVFDNLGSPLLKELGLLRHVKVDMDKLRSNLSTIISVLEDVDRRSIRDDARARDWLRKLKSAAFDADHVVDEYQIEALLRRIPRSLLMQVRDFFSLHNPIVFRHRMARKIKDVTKRFGEIEDECRNYHLAEESASASASASERLFNDRETDSHVMESDVYGRDEDKEKVIHLLVDTDNDRDVSILPIVGLGGVGKTTLAQLVYNNDKIKKHFELPVWICVSETFEVKNIIGNILECITKQKCNLSTLQTMQGELRDKLTNKKFLLVLDDVLNEDKKEWEDFKLLFRGGKNGSKILLTTRSDIVAGIMGTMDPYKLKELPDDVCWTLFRDRAFGMGREKETPMLIKIGKEIVAKCGGLPLAAKALASFMSYKRGEVEWLAVKNSEIWKLLTEETKDILPALRLSYDHLSSQLKQCFGYCSLFPKDYKLEKERLIKLWIAEGFIPSTDDAEDTGNRHFNVLLWSSFFQDVEKDDYGNIVYCKMHDLVHDLACYVAGKERCTMEADLAEGFTSREAECERDVSVEYRYVSLNIEGDDRSVIPNKLYQLNKLRTFLTITSYPLVQSVGVHWGMLSKHLRVLDLNNTRIEELPDNLDRLKHLRFLDLSYTGIRTLPASIISLQNLQTLNLSYCDELQRLPQGIIFLSRLRHLHLSYTRKLTCMPCGMGRLTNLRTLTKFIVGKERGSSSIVELQHLKLIGGDLKIKGLCNVKDANQAGLANLAAKTGLQRLQLISKDNRGSSAGNIDDVDVDVLKNLRPPNNLKELKIVGFAGSWLPRWMKTMESGMESSSSIYPRLEFLEIRECPKLSRVHPCILSSATELKISNSNEELLSGRCLEVGGGMTSKIKKLVIESCTASSLSGYWQGLQHLSNLEEMTIQWCSGMTCLPEGILHHHFPKLKSLTLIWNHQLVSLAGGGGDGEPPFFTALQRLQIKECQALTALPEWLVNLTTLQELQIYGCPLLETRYKRESSQDWKKIAHIPSVTIK